MRAAHFPQPAAQCNIDALRAKKCLRPTQVAGERARISGQGGAAACLSSADPQKVSGGTGPGGVLGHEPPDASGDRVRVDDALDGSLTVGCFAKLPPLGPNSHVTWLVRRTLEEAGVIFIDENGGSGTGVRRE